MPSVSLPYVSRATNLAVLGRPDKPVRLSMNDSDNHTRHRAARRGLWP